MLDLPENKAIKSQLSDLVSQVQRHGKAGGEHGGSSGNGNGSGPSHHRSPAELLAECRRLAMQVAVPRNVRDELEKAMREAGAGLS